MRLWRSSLLAVLGCLFLTGCRQKVARLEWPVMGTVAAVQTRGYDETVRGMYLRDTLVKGRLEEIAGLLNAHDPESELSRLAPLSDDAAFARCSESVRPCYACAFMLAPASDGAFNPRWRGPGTLDFGAIAKGFAVDRAAQDVADSLGTGEPPPDVLLDLGGNLKAVRGDWKTGVMDPSGAGLAATVELREGEALATSATYYRGAHIADGRTGRPVSNDVASVTVLCRSAMWADGLSTTLFILGPDAGRAFLDNKLSARDGDLAVSVLWILKDGAQHTYGDARFSRN